jgi:hypothetical protein
MNVVQTIRYARRILADRTTSKQEKALMLMHCVGDIHQPLHSTALFSRHLFPGGDRGGNSIPVLDQVHQSANVHEFWDELPGSNIEFATARTEALRLRNDPQFSALGKKAAILDEKTWLDESHRLALTAAYDRTVLSSLRAAEQTTSKLNKLEPITLSERYLAKARPISNRRLIESGYRLGALLKLVSPNAGKRQK